MYKIIAPHPCQKSRVPSSLFHFYDNTALLVAQALELKLQSLLFFSFKAQILSLSKSLFTLLQHTEFQPLFTASTATTLIKATISSCLNYHIRFQAQSHLRGLTFALTLDWLLLSTYRLQSHLAFLVCNPTPIFPISLPQFIFL